MPCKYCGHERPLINAHVLPEAFFRFMASEETSPLYMLSTSVAAHPKRAPIGVYDQGILCRACEDRFQDFDDYASRLLIHDRDTVFRPVEGEQHLFVAESVDYPKLKLFILSMLWRASVSTHPFYRCVDLGPRLARVRLLIDDRDPGAPNEFGTVLSRWVPTAGKALPPKFIGSPVNRRYDGIRAVKLYLGPFIADVCTDSRPFPNPLADVAIAPGRPVFALGLPLSGSKDLEAFGPVLRRHGRRLAGKLRRPR